MKILTDPVTGERLILYGSKGNDDDTVYRVNVDAVIQNLCHYFQVDETEVIRRLRNSDALDPIVYHDEVFWVE